MRKERGSAIVIALLLITAVGAVGFAFGRVLNLQINNASQYENGVGAYYAAESGIEEGFLRYRYDRNSQVPCFLAAASCSGQSWLYPANKYMVERANLTSGLSVGTSVDKTNLGNYNTQILSNLTSQFYDLRMGSAVGNGNTSVSGDPLGGDPNSVLVSGINNPNYGPVGSPYHIARDGTAKIDLGSMVAAGSDVNLYFKQSGDLPDTPAVFQTAGCAIIEAKVTGVTVDGRTVEWKKMLRNSDSVSCSTSNIITDESTASYYGVFGSGAFQMLNLISIVTDTQGATLDKATLFLKPIGADISYLLSESNTDTAVIGQNPLNGALAVITSTGYYGGAARTLESRIDRGNGSLYDLYDYVIFKKSN